MTYSRLTRPKAANDNRHDPDGWEKIHNFAYKFLEGEKIPLDKWHFNRSIHYGYELINRPWLPIEKRIDDYIDWFFAEKRDLEYGIGDFAGMN